MLPFRPLRSSQTPNGGAETFETQHERELAKLALKKAQAQETQDRIMRSLYPTPEDKQVAAADAQLQIDQHYRTKEQQR